MDLRSEASSARNAGSLKQKPDDLTLPEIAARVAFSTVLTVIIIIAAFLALRIIL